MVMSGKYKPTEENRRIARERMRLKRREAGIPEMRRASSEELSRERLSALLMYNEDSGVFTWRHSRKVAGWHNGKGYMRIEVDGRMYMTHRLAWLWCSGEWPEYQIDHIDGDRSNNRIANLRKATNADNQYNTKIRSNNTSGYRGVTFHRQSGKWRAAAKLNGKCHSLGLHSTPELAREAYMKFMVPEKGEFLRDE